MSETKTETEPQDAAASGTLAPRGAEAAPGTPGVSGTPDVSKVAASGTGKIVLGGIQPSRPMASSNEGILEGAAHEFADQVGDPRNALGPFSHPQSTMIAGIEEHVGYIPGWLLVLLIIAVLLAMVMWIPTSY